MNFNYPDKIKCGCGRSPTRFCTGLHKMTNEEYQNYLKEQLLKEQSENKPQLLNE